MFLMVVSQVTHMGGHLGQAIHLVMETAINHVSGIATIAVIHACVVGMSMLMVLKQRRLNAQIAQVYILIS